MEVIWYCTPPTGPILAGSCCEGMGGLHFLPRPLVHATPVTKWQVSVFLGVNGSQYLPFHFHFSTYLNCYDLGPTPKRSQGCQGSRRKTMENKAHFSFNGNILASQMIWKYNPYFVGRISIRNLVDTCGLVVWLLGSQWEILESRHWTITTLNL